ncbi:MAG: ribosome maturation factor RimP [Pseudomonadota bacterium]
MRQASGKIYELLAPVVTGLGYELVGIEHISQGRHSLLRIYIDVERGVTVDDCEKVSHQVSGVLDVEDPIKGAYHLEVSSPGLDRPLFTAEHFARFAGHKAKVQLRSPINGRRKFSGAIRSVGDGAVRLEIEEGEVSLPLDAIEKANLIPEF